jgi:Ohr subfamily peroxiredoxin
MKPLYTATATAKGEGRFAGHAETEEGQLRVDLRLPKALGGDGGGTNPEQLVALGYAACFLGALRNVAGQKKLRLENPAVTCRVTIGQDADHFALSFEIEVALPGLDDRGAEDLVQGAHQVCPYSRAFRNGAPSVVRLAAPTH